MRSAREAARTLLVVLAIFAACGQCAESNAAGPQAPLPAEIRADRLGSGVSPGNVQRRKGAAARREEHRLRQFVSPEGVLTITNRPEKYRREEGFKDITIKFEPIVVAPRFKAFKSAAQYTSSNIDELVRTYSKQYALDHKLVNAVIQAESGFNPYAVSSAGARGLMQLMPGTAADMGVDDIFDPAQNIAGGAQYLAKMLSLFDNKLELALAAYNAGPGAVKKHGGIPPYAETQAYVKTVMAYMGKTPKMTVKPNYHVTAKKPTANSIPKSNKNCYTIHFHSGYTQLADKVIDEDPYYYVRYGNRTALVRKEHVAKIIEPA